MGGSSFNYTFNYTAGFKENLRAGRVAWRRLFPLHIQFVVVAAGVLPVLVGIGAGYWLAANAGPTVYSPIFILLGLGAGALLGRPIAVAANQWSVRRLGGQASRDDVDSSLTMAQDGITFVSSEVDCRISWRGIDRVFLDRGALYFVMGMGVYHVPARCFASDVERKAALGFALARLASKGA
jgi:hypothetical protein